MAKARKKQPGDINPQISDQPQLKTLVGNNNKIKQFYKYINKDWINALIDAFSLNEFLRNYPEKSNIEKPSKNNNFFNKNGNISYIDFSGSNGFYLNIEGPVDGACFIGVPINNIKFSKDKPISTNECPAIFNVDEKNLNEEDRLKWNVIKGLIKIINMNGKQTMLEAIKEYKENMMKPSGVLNNHSSVSTSVSASASI